MMISDSETETFRRQVFCDREIFCWKDVPSSGDSIPTPVPVKSNGCKRRVIHIDYADIFGDMSHPEFQQVKPSSASTVTNLFVEPVPVPPSPVYEETIYEPDEYLEYFPQRRGTRSRLTANIVKNLSSEFEKLADDEPNNVIGHKNFLQLPPANGFQFFNNLKKRDDMKSGMAASGNSSRDENYNRTVFLRRKPTFRVDKDSTKPTTEDGGNSNCVIC